MICAAEELSAKSIGWKRFNLWFLRDLLTCLPDVGLLFLVGEETDHCGAKAANALGLKPRLIVCGEPTESRVAAGQKGILKIMMRAKVWQLSFRVNTRGTEWNAIAQLEWGGRHCLGLCRCKEWLITPGGPQDLSTTQ